MSAEWFLWGGLVISVVWHLASWLVWQMETGVALATYYLSEVIGYGSKC